LKGRRKEKTKKKIVIESPQRAICQRTTNRPSYETGNLTKTPRNEAKTKTFLASDCSILDIEATIRPTQLPQ
jgi:hypothetical protein